MLIVHVAPAGAEAALAGSETLGRLQHGDALDLAMFGSALLASLLAEAAAVGATDVAIEVEGPGEVHRDLAAAHDLELRREILRLERPLPLDGNGGVALRPFVPGQDDEAWVAVNNRAFAWHPDQADWTLADLHARMAEPWFDAAGFLVHESDGTLDGFCWTKVHADERPPVGEIYVIGVDPDAQGGGLGRALVVAGLDHLAAAGLERGMLWVEADNAPARRLYDDLGFVTVSSRCWWGRAVGPAGTGAGA